MGYIALALIFGGLGGIIWHTVNALRPRPREGEFRAFGRAESGWAILVSILMIVVGIALEFMLYFGWMPARVY